MIFVVRYTGGSEEHPNIVAALEAARLLVLCGAKRVQVIRARDNKPTTHPNTPRGEPRASWWVPLDYEDLEELPS